ncbi:hypothetical protein QAD02_008130 [Eretmocerus hayati]|uniref:Uncharacterized protein n=1 Tax=Eretmocerus hayati TaxID=131215 RepID=A0ACC2N6X3_9HYME|nr:hypothetical protein QAD02_008130 [Eretmocerus hayati]
MPSDFTFMNLCELYPKHPNKNYSLDLIFSSKNLCRIVPDYEILSPTDEHLILALFAVEFQAEPELSKRHKFVDENFFKADCGKITYILRQLNWVGALSNGDVEQDVELFNNILDDCVKKHVPGGNGKTDDPEVLENPTAEEKLPLEVPCNLPEHLTLRRSAGCANLLAACDSTTPPSVRTGKPSVTGPVTPPSEEDDSDVQLLDPVTSTQLAAPGKASGESESEPTPPVTQEKDEQQDPDSQPKLRAQPIRRLT